MRKKMTPQKRENIQIIEAWMNDTGAPNMEATIKARPLTNRMANRAKAATKRWAKSFICLLLMDVIMDAAE